MIYLGVHDIKEFDRWDILRILIPPVAFIGWAMLQSPSSFDIFALDVDKRVGAVIAGGLAIILGLSARVPTSPINKRFIRCLLETHWIWYLCIFELDGGVANPNDQLLTSWQSQSFRER